MNFPFKAHTYIFIFLFTSIFSTSGFGQLEFPTLSAAEPDSVLQKKIKAIPLNQIPGKIEEAEETIKNGQKKILPKRSILEIDSLFPVYVKFLEVQKKDAREFIKANPNRQKIDHLINKWDGYHGQLHIWQEKVNSYEDKNMDVITPFRELEILWSKTYDQAKIDNAPPSLLNNIKRTKNDIIAIKKALNAENNELLTLETKIINQKAIVLKTIDEFNYLKNSDIYNVFYKRHVVFWKASLSDSKDSKGEKMGAAESLPNNFSNIGKYINKNINNIISFFVIIILFIVFFIYFKNYFLKVKFTEQDATLQRAKGIIVDHTISGIIFSLFILALFFFQNIPFLLADLIFLFVLISAVPLLKSVIYNRFKNATYFIILFHVLNSAKTYIWFTSTYYRVFILIEALLVIFTIFYFTYPYLKTLKLKTGGFGKLLLYTVPALYLLAFISIVSNVLGYTNLTDLALKIATQSSVLTMVFYGILMVVSGLILGGLHMIISRQKNFVLERKLLIEKRSIQFIRVVIFSWWFFYFLGMIDLREPFLDWFNDLMIDPHNFGSVSFTLGEIITFILVLTGSFLLSNLLSMIVDGGVLNFLKLPKGIPAAISLVFRYFIIAFGFVLALSALGVNLSSFNLMAGALGLGIGFGLQNIISNFVSGIILVFERPILPGDTVEVQNLLGKVTNIGVRSSKVRTFDGAEVIVPNNNLISNDLINWTLSDNIKRLEIKIGAAYGTDPNIVLEILKEEAFKNEFTLSDPDPVALFDEFGDSSLNFRLLVWVPYDKGLQSKSNISIGIYNHFKEKGIQIPFPQQDVYIKEIVENAAVKKKAPIKTEALKKTSTPIKKDEDNKPNKEDPKSLE